MSVPIRAGAFAVASDGDTYLTAFEDFREVGTSRVRLARIGADGRLLDSIPIAIPQPPDARAIRHFLLMWDGLEYLLAWYESGHYYLLRVAPDGRIVDPTPRVVSFESGFASVVWTGSKLLSMYPDGDGVIHARGIDPSGAQTQFSSSRPAGLTNWSSLVSAVWTSEGGVSFWNTQSPDGTINTLSTLRFDSTWQPTSAPTSLGPTVASSVIAASKSGSAFVMWRDPTWACRAAVLDSQNTFINSCPALDLTYAISAVGVPSGFAAVTSDLSLPYRVTRFSVRGVILDSKTVNDGLLADSPPLLASNGSSIASVWESPTAIRAPSGVGTGPLFAQLLSSNLDAMPPARSVALASAAPPQTSADAACNGSRCGVAVAEERVAGQLSLLVGRITSDGVMVDGDGIELGGRQAAQPRVVFDGRDFVIVHTEGSILSATRIGVDEPTPDARALLDRSIPIAGDVAKFAAATDHAGNVAVAWTNGPGDDMCAAVITNAGATSPVCLGGHPAVSDPTVAFTGNEFVVAWHQLAVFLDPRVPLLDLMTYRLSPGGTWVDPSPHRISIPTSIRADLRLFAVPGRLVATWEEDYGKSLVGVRITPSMEIEAPPFRIPFGNLPYAEAADAHGLTIVSLQEFGALQSNEYTLNGERIGMPALVATEVSAAHSVRLIPFGDGRDLILYGHPSAAAAGSLRSFARLLGDPEQSRRRAIRH